jgi:hypothetical protein
MIDLKPGDRLPNDAVLILYRVMPHRPGHNPEAVVLAYADDSAFPWVTWRYQACDHPFCIEGEYRLDFREALYDWYERCGEHRPILVDEETWDAYREAWEAELSS